MEWDFYGFYYSAETPFGEYVIEENEVDEDKGDIRFEDLLLYTGKTLEKAKKLAQADFEKRVKKCLE